MINLTGVGGEGGEGERDAEIIFQRGDERTLIFFLEVVLKAPNLRLGSARAVQKMF
jgi:hypothetical protein